MMLKSDAQTAPTAIHAPSAKGNPVWRHDRPLTIALAFLALFTYVPFVTVIINSFKDNPQFFQQFWLPALPLHTDNYGTAWPVISQSIFNSVVYSTPTILLVLAVSGLTGYAFARYRFWG